MVDSLLDWAPLLWTLRVVALILLGALGLTTFLYFARFCRPRHVLGMLRAPLPQIQEIGGEAFGNKLAVKIDKRQNDQLEALAARTEEMERISRQHRAILETLVDRTLAKEEQHGLFD
jgi:hypothetical protein